MATSTAIKEVEVQYFAVLREQRGLSCETISTSAETLRQLYDELAARHGFQVPWQMLAVAVGQRLSAWEDKLVDKSHIFFIPPVAGG